MIDRERTNKYSSFARIVASYLATISLLLLVQYHRAPKWKVFIDHSVGLSALSIVALASSLFSLSMNRRWICSLLRSEVVQYGMLILSVVLGLYWKLSILELIVFSYTVYAIFFIRSSLETNRLYKPARKLTNDILDSILDVESRTPAVLALLLLISLPFLMVLKKTTAAESVAMYVYYLLAITVILQILEVKQGIEKENRLYALFMVGSRAFYRTLTDHQRRSRMFERAWMIVRQALTRRNLAHGAVLLTLLAGIYSAKYSHWKRVMHAVDGSAEYRSELALNGNDSGSYTFPSYADEIIVPIKVKHPLSNPLWWPESGDNAVRFKIEWFSWNYTAKTRRKMFVDYQPIPRPLFINDSSVVQLQLKRPDVFVDRVYEVRVGLVFDKNKWFSVNSDNVLNLRVKLEPLSGSKAIAHEYKIQALMQDKVDERWSDKLSSSQNDYRSKIEIIRGNPLTPVSTITLSVTNKSSLPWPAFNQHAVKLGVAWMQKRVEGETAHFIQLAKDAYPLSNALLPGEKTIVKIKLEPRKEPEADEIWIGMVHEGKTWFYTRGDAVIKLPNKDKLPTQQLADLQKKNLQLETELLALLAKKARSSELNDDKMTAHDDDYRSKIQLVNDVSTDRLLTYANSLPLDLEITNSGNIPWIPTEELPVNLGILWFKNDGKVSLASPRISEERCTFPFSVLRDVTIRMQCAIGAKILPGDYEVWISPVYEGTAWFYEKGDTVLKLHVKVQ
jgi:hypothetical protein